jgi:hypothetical protein
MDFSKLSQNEKLATYGSVAVIVGALVGLGAAGLGFIAVLAAIGMLAVVFLPQLSPSTKLPGSLGSLMLVLGAVAAVILVLGFLSVLSIFGFLLENAFIPTLFYLIAVVGGVVMAWAGWNEFQGEGGKFQIGTASSGTASTSADAPPPAATQEPPAQEPPAQEPPAQTPPATDRDDEGRPTL